MSTKELKEFKDDLEKKLTAFRRQRFVRGKGLVEDLVITSKDILTSQLRDSIKKGYVVILKDTGYDIEGRKKYQFLDYGTNLQHREEIKKFPWE